VTAAPIIPSLLLRLRQMELEFKANLCYMARPNPKKNPIKQNHHLIDLNSFLKKKSSQRVLKGTLR
jgi:hypothetical protein